MRTSNFNFKSKTWKQIEQLKAILETKKQTVYPTLGHFYREIELVKFPFLAKGFWAARSKGRNIYSQQQYDSILNYCIASGWIIVMPNVFRKNAYQVHVSKNIDWKITQPAK
jgi:hypothetical protein